MLGYQMKSFPEDQKFLVAKEDRMYLSQAGVVSTGERLVCTYLRADQHTNRSSDLMVCYSIDQGRTWQGHRSMSHLNVSTHKAIWIAPELNRLKDGRLALICDKGPRTDMEPFLSIYLWQKERGMSNHVFWSDDDGVTWSDPQKIDELGGEPERIHQLSNGDLVYTLIEGTERRQFAHIALETSTGLPSRGYYRCILMASEDNGVTFHRRAVLSDNPYYSDAEVGLVEVSPGKIMSISRCGESVRNAGQPSVIHFSEDYGKTWGNPILTPYYGARPIPGMLQSGNVLVTYRNVSGTPGTYAAIFDPDHIPGYSPNSHLWDESRCVIRDGAMTLDTAEGFANAAIFHFFPAEDEHSTVVIEAVLAVKEADVNGCSLCAGCWIQLEPGRLSIAERPDQFVELDATHFNHYKIVRADGKIAVWINGECKIETSLDGIAVLPVRIGNRSFDRNRSLSIWKSVSISVTNANDRCLDWEWEPGHGYPDQFRRDHLVELDKNGTNIGGNSGYSGWTQMEDGTVVVTDYTVGGQIQEKYSVQDFLSAFHEVSPFIRSYVGKEDDFIGNLPVGKR